MELEQLGYQVIEIWECEIKEDTWLSRVLLFLE